MKKIIFASIATALVSNFIQVVYADDNLPYPTYPPLNQISLQLSEEAWATTQTAKVIVGMNAALSAAQLGTIHADVMANLKKLVSEGDWHITQFNRSKSDTGLEQLYVQAEARIPETQLATVRDKAKTISKPGENYEIVAIEFTPSTEEIEQVRTDLRNKVYGEANAELGRINKMYSQDQYYLHSISFNTVEEPMPMAVRPMMLGAVAPGAAKEADAGGLAVSNKIKVTADVVLASTYQGKKTITTTPNS